jgi:hypothetical protein
MSAIGTVDERNPVADDADRGAALEDALAEGAAEVFAAGLAPPHATMGKMRTLQAAKNRRIRHDERNRLLVAA